MVSRASRQVLNVQVHSLGARRAALLRRHPLLAPALAEIQKWGDPELFMISFIGKMMIKIHHLEKG